MSTEYDRSDERPRKKHKSKHDRTEKKEKKKQRNEEPRNENDHDEERKHKKKRKHRDKEGRNSKRPIHLEVHDPVIEPKFSQDSVKGSPFYLQTSSFYLPLSPIAQESALESLYAEHLSPMLLTYQHQFRAVVLSYSNVRVGERPLLEQNDGEVLARSADEYAVSFIWMTADFLLFKPGAGDNLEGWLNLQTRSHVGLIYLNLFNASIERKRLDKEWTWTDLKSMNQRKRETLEEENEGSGRSMHQELDEGFFEDIEGRKIEGRLQFRVKDVEPSAGRDKGFLSIEGTMLKDFEEAELTRQETSAYINETQPVFS